MTALLWFRRDLRIDDNAALLAALADGPVVPVYVLDDEGAGDFAMGAAQRWWLHHSLAALDQALGGKLLLRRGPAAIVVAQVADEVGASAIHATRLYDPWQVAAEQALGDRLTLHDGDTLIPPEELLTGGGAPYRIYGPFWRKLAAMLPPPEPFPAPQSIALADAPRGDRLDDWNLLPATPDWASGFGAEWTPGEAGARQRLADFESEAGDYARRRDLPSIDGTSRLSPHLHFGEISPRRVWHSLRPVGGGKFLKELAWRDFARSAVRAQPGIGTDNGRSAMNALRWRAGPAADADFTAWTRGRTGFPIVDAGMRQLWASGWMHNRVRMIAASFLVKHLLIDWRRGAAWFWDTLVDADYANNSLNWQWIAGTGTDSQLFNRIMAPLSQSAKFDAADYVRSWVPELRGLSDALIHDPPANVRGSYPAKIVGHEEGRTRALAALAKLRSGED
ncbi:MAG: deoxyribodipyrimidine photo-lyase [Pseudomonadota bacterium]